MAVRALTRVQKLGLSSLPGCWCKEQSFCALWQLVNPRWVCAVRAGALPQPGPIFQALPEPAPLPELPQPAMAPESAPGGEPQPRAALQARHHRENTYFGITRKLQQAPLEGPPGTVPEATQPFAAEAPLTAPGPPLSAFEVHTPC